jgi:hypothetical protein
MVSLFALVQSGTNVLKGQPVYTASVKEAFWKTPLRSPLFGDFLIAGNYERHCRNAVAFACLQKLLFPECRSQTSPLSFAQARLIGKKLPAVLPAAALRIATISDLQRREAPLSRYKH